MEAAPGLPGILTLDSEGFRYTYHVLTDTESLFDLGADPKCLNNLAPLEQKMTNRLRLQILSSLGVGSFDEVRQGFRPDIERLRGLGYI